MGEPSKEAMERARKLLFSRHWPGFTELVEPVAAEMDAFAADAFGTALAIWRKQLADALGIPVGDGVLGKALAAINERDAALRRASEAEKAARLHEAAEGKLTDALVELATAKDDAEERVRVLEAHHATEHRRCEAWAAAPQKEAK